MVTDPPQLYVQNVPSWISKPREQGQEKTSEHISLNEALGYENDYEDLTAALFGLDDFSSLDF